MSIFRKPKIDSKVRFQTNRFRQELAQARNYKRKPLIRVMEGSGFQKALSYIGLGNIWLQILLLILLAGIFYLIYIPNFFYIKNIQVNGIPNDQHILVETTVKKFNSRISFAPYRHFFFLRTATLASQISKENPTLIVESVTRKWPNQLIVSVKQRTADYTYTFGETISLISSDGVVIDQKTATTTGTTPNLPQLILANAFKPYVGQVIIQPLYQTAFASLKNSLLLAFGDGVSQISADEASEEYRATTTLGTKLILDPHMSGEELESKLRLLASEFTKVQRQGIAYIDLRFKTRGFVCFKDQGCARQQAIMPMPTSTLETVATSTP